MNGDEQAFRFLREIDDLAAEADPDDILTKSLPTATKLAYWIRGRTNSTIPLEDLQQTALLALLEVFNSGRVDPTEERFDKYLTTVIAQKLYASIRENSPVYLRPGTRYDALRYGECLESGLTDEEIAKKFNWRSDRLRSVKRAYASLQPMTSTDLPLSEDGSLTVGSTLPDDTPGPEAVVLDEFEAQEIQNEIQDAINKLPIRQAQALSFAFCVPANVTAQCTVADVMGAFEVQANASRGMSKLREGYKTNATGTRGVSADGFYSTQKVTGKTAAPLLERRWGHYRTELLTDTKIPG